MIPRIGKCKRQTGSLLFGDEWNGVKKTEPLCVAQSHSGTDRFISSTEIVPRQHHSIIDLGEILIPPPDIEIPVDQFKYRNRENVPSFFYEDENRNNIR